jgi:2-phospho-L-lactate guanylyltransferase
VTIVPDRHATGTNGLLLTPPDVIGPAFGPNSCERHRALAHAAGASCRLEHPASLLLDIDTGADLDALRERLHATHAAASRTRAALARPEDEMTLSLADSR